jgi:hypothetical protein
MENVKMRDQQILKAVLLLRRVNRYTSKEKQIAEVNNWFKKGYFTDEQLQEWIEALQTLDTSTDEERLLEMEELETDEAEWEREYTSCTARDYGPSNPWDAPGMSVRDFI